MISRPHRSWAQGILALACLFLSGCGGCDTPVAKTKAAEEPRQSKAAEKTAEKAAEKVAEKVAEKTASPVAEAERAPDAPQRAEASAPSTPGGEAPSSGSPPAGAEDGAKAAQAQREARTLLERAQRASSEGNPGRAYTLAAEAWRRVSPYNDPASRELASQSRGLCETQGQAANGAVRGLSSKVQVIK